MVSHGSCDLREVVSTNLVKIETTISENEIIKLTL